MKTSNAVTSVKVRMYRQGFGDCFLLSFFQDKKRIFTMLIDCGIKLNTKSKEVPIEKVIADLKATLTPDGAAKPKLDVLVATHEHWDHIAFFHPTRFPDFFNDFEIGQVWLAWTEDPDDKEAATINSRLRDGAAALHVAAMKLQAAEKDEADQAADMRFGLDVKQARMEFNRKMDDVLGFYGVTALKSDSGITYRTNGKVSTQTEQSMERIIKLGADGGGIKYFSPGTTVDEQFVPKGVNIFVLGPPKSSLINQSNPSRGDAHETYLSIDRSGMSSFVDGLLGMGAAGDGKASSVGSPFGKGVGIAADEAEKDPYFADTYFAKKEAYRKIEHNWLDLAGQFALQLDGAINNTSLVLAIELADSGKVLLFPGDAQVGSWLSWHDFEWKVKKGSTTEKYTAKDLLNNTVLYKVSHHGSHNATVKEKGLELMTHAELVALIPEKEDSYSGILYQPLLDRLNELCKGRVVISADVKYPPDDLKKTRPPGLSAVEWEAFKNQLTITPLYVEYTVLS
ncbi:MAG TPA: hypothetical protein VHR66_18040 [Gemmataceae bacterium]|jgi:hypothetical protein|nr:hypothetical protein [Gemmataceae bacterium]